MFVFLLVLIVIVGILLNKKRPSAIRSNPPDEILDQLKRGSTSQDILDAGKGADGVNLNNY